MVAGPARPGGGECGGPGADQRPGRGAGVGRGVGRPHPADLEQVVVVTACGVPQHGWLLGEPATRDLAGGCPRDRGDLVDLLGHLEGRQPRAAQFDQLRGVQLGGGRDDVGDRYFPQRVVRSSGHSGVGDARGRAQYRLDLLRVEVLAASDHEVRDPAADGEVAVLVAPGQVAGAVPAVPQRRRGLLRPAVVAEHDVRSADPHLALAPGGDVRAGVGIDDADPDPGHRQPAGTVDPHAVGRVHGDRPARLRAAVGVHQGRTEALAERTAQLGVGDRAADEADPQVGQRERLPADRLDQVVVGGGNPGQEGRPVGAQSRQDILRGGAVHDVGARPDHGHRQHARDVGQAVEQRKRPEHPVFRRESGNRDVARGDGPEAVALGGQHPLRLSGRPRGVEHPGGVVQSEIVRRGRRGLGDRQFVEGAGALRRRARARHQQRGLGCRPGQAEKIRRVHGVGDDDGRAAVRQQPVQLGGGGRRVDRYAHAAGPDDREVTLHHGHAVAQADRHSVAAPHSESGQMPGQPTRPLLQLIVGDRPLAVREGDLVREAGGVPAEGDGQDFDQVSTHGSHVLSRSGSSAGARPAPPAFTSCRGARRSCAGAALRLHPPGG